MSDTNLNTFKKLYLEKDYTGAVKWLEQGRSDFDPEIYHYNLGTVLYKQEKFAEARFHFEKAESLGMYTPALLKNLNAARTQLNVETFESSDHFIDHWYQTGTSVSTDILWSLAFLVILGALALKYLKKAHKGILITLVILGFLPLALKYFYFSQFSYVVALNRQAVFEGPSKIFSQSTSLPIGSKLLIKNSKENWSEVLSPVRASGWIEKRAFKSLTLDL